MEKSTHERILEGGSAIHGFSKFFKLKIPFRKLKKDKYLPLAKAISFENVDDLVYYLTKKGYKGVVSDLKKPYIYYDIEDLNDGVWNEIVSVILYSKNQRE
jgi:hypothetical protein